MYLGTKERKWILVVDDEADIRSSIKEVIKLQFGQSVEVIEAKDGIEATTKINYQKFDCIITDLSMPRKEGEAFINSIRHNALNEITPVIVVSGQRNANKMKNLYEFIEVIEKPYRMNHLMETLTNQLKMGSNKNRVSAEALNSLISAIEQFVVSMSMDKVEQQGPVQVKRRGEVVDHDFVSSIQVKIGTVRNTFSILAREKELTGLFKDQKRNTRVEIQQLIQSMCYVLLKHVVEKSIAKKTGAMKGQYIEHDKSVLTEKQGLLITLANDKLKIDVFATSQ